VRDPRHDFADLVEPIALALEQERKVTEQISDLTGIARDERDYVSEQFMQWFLREQVEEIDLMSSLLAVAERSKERPMEIEEYIERESIGGDQSDPAAPPEAGAG
jgi:ferritin